MRDNLRHIADRIRDYKHEIVEESKKAEEPRKADERRAVLALLEKSFMDHVDDKEVPDASSSIKS